METLKKLLFLLSVHERKRASLLLIMIIIMALLDVVGVASILPFMTVLTNPSIVETNLILNYLYQSLNIFGVENNEQFLFALGIISFTLLVFSLTFKAITTYAQFMFIENCEYSIGKRLLEKYLQQPYSWFLNQHSADLGKTILSEVQQVNRYGMKAIMELTSQGFVAIALVTLIIIIDPKLAITVGIFLFGIYGIIFYFISKHLNKIGKERLKNNNLRFMLLNEGFVASKEIKFKGLEQTYINSFSNAAKNYAKTMATSQVISQLPRFILEALAFGGILLILLFLIAQSGSFNQTLPIVSLYVFAGYRMMPALQQVYRSITELTFIGSSLNKIFYDLKNLLPPASNQNNDIISFNQMINLKNVYYNYPNKSEPTLKNININIPAGSTVGLIGGTGSGKTTTVDIILGLLEVSRGSLEVDGIVINKQNFKSWQRLIGYVPQRIFLTDDTVAANIAFGIETKNINQTLVEKCAKIANVDEFVKKDLHNQYQTKVGENGSRLSGGQRQRIGIARALYCRPKVLILDEATSALDNQTEMKVMQSIYNLNENMTIILIAHRFNILKKCDIIFKIEKGQIIKQETASDFLKAND